MFYSQFVLAKRGALSNVWLAAHWEKKLTRQMINKTDIPESVASIIRPQVPIALRTSGHLLLGVVRIYAQKVRFLLSDCSDASGKLRQAFKPGVVDLPVASTAALSVQVTIPQGIDMGELDGMDLGGVGGGLVVPANRNNLFAAGVATNMSRPQDITMEDVPRLSYRGIDSEDLDTFGGRPGEASFMGHLSSGLSSFADSLDIEVGRDAHLGADEFQMGPELSSNRGSSVLGDIDHARAGSVASSAFEPPVAGIDEFGGGGGGGGGLDDLFMQPVADESHHISLGGRDSIASLVSPVKESAAATVVVQQKKRKRPAVKEDNSTELTEKQLKKQVEDPSGLVADFVADNSWREVKLQKLRHRAAGPLDANGNEPETGVTVPFTTIPASMLNVWNKLSVHNNVPDLPWQTAKKSVAEPAEAALPPAPVLGAAAVEEVEVARDAHPAGAVDVDVGLHNQSLDYDYGGGGGGGGSLEDIFPDNSNRASLTAANLSALNQSLGGMSGVGLGDDNDSDASEIRMSMGNRASGGAAAAAAAVGETDGWTKNTAKALKVFKSKFNESNQQPLSFGELTQTASRKTKAIMFFELLVLSSKNYVGVSQEPTPGQNVGFGDITITAKAPMAVA